ncbi:MAG: hypothetical protein ACLFPV_14025 [Spirochaetaceae bacterium]
MKRLFSPRRAAGTFRTLTWAKGPLAALLVFLFASCAVSQDTLLRSDGGAEAAVRIELSPILVSYLEDLTLAFAPEAEFRVFDLALLRENLENEPGVRVLRLAEEPTGTLAMTLDIASLEQLQRGASPAVSGLLSVEESPLGTALEVSLGPKEISDLLTFAGAADARALSVFFPPPPSDGDASRRVTREGYIDDAVWVLEEYAPAEDIEEAIRASGVGVTVAAPREVLSVDGGRKEGGRARFDISLLELVTLREPRRYTVIYR